jgi:mono/diheme cytochrome c family protein
MSKRPFVILGSVTVAVVVFFTFWGIERSGEPRGAQEVPARYETGKELFDVNCGTCHTLAAAGTDGNFAPDLDTLLYPTGNDGTSVKATASRVLNAVENGVDTSTTPGRMPAGILAGEQAKQVAEFVGAQAGK